MSDISNMTNKINDDVIVEHDTESKNTALEKIEQMNVFCDQPAINDINKEKIKNIKKGDLLEYRLKRLIFFMGYYPRVGILIKTSQSEMADRITDLDVYGVYLHKNFTSNTIWADCKSGQSRPLERISWINGVKSIIKINDIIFVKKNVRQTTKQFARTQGIQVLDLDMIEKLEKNFKIEEGDWRGSWNPETQIKQLAIFQKINIPNSVTYKKIGNFISCNYWSLDNYTQIKKIITALKQLSETEQFPLPSESVTAVKWVIFELISLFTLATFNICKEIYYFTHEEKKSTVSDGLISGEISVQKRAEIIEATYKVAYSIIQKQVPNFTSGFHMPNLVMNPPVYFEEFYDLILRITNNPLNYFDLLRFMDFLFMEYDLQSQKVDFIEMKKIFGDCENLLISTKTILHFICNVTGVSRSIFGVMR